MSRFSELSSYKNNIMMQLLTNENLMKAITNNQSDFLNYDLPVEFQEDITKLLFTQIFPYKQVQSKITDTKSYITMAFVNFRPENNSTQIKNGMIYFYVVVHNSLLRTDEGLRYDYIVSQIDKTINGLRGISIGRVNLSEESDMPIDENYMGSYIAYKITDFQ